MYERFIRTRLVESLTDTPAVLLVGPRRAGKTTLARSMNNGGRVYLTLDDQTTLEAARSDPIAFVRGLDLAIIDETQIGRRDRSALAESTGGEARGAIIGHRSSWR